MGVEDEGGQKNKAHSRKEYLSYNFFYSLQQSALNMHKHTTQTHPQNLLLLLLALRQEQKKK